MPKTYKEVKELILSDPETQLEYDALRAEYQIIQELVELRIQENLTLEELSKSIGIPKSNISRFENGKHSPTLHTLERFAAGLNKRLQIKLVNAK